MWRRDNASLEARPATVYPQHRDKARGPACHSPPPACAPGQRADECPPLQGRTRPTTMLKAREQQNPTRSTPRSTERGARPCKPRAGHGQRRIKPERERARHRGKLDIGLAVRRPARPSYVVPQSCVNTWSPCVFTECLEQYQICIEIRQVTKRLTSHCCRPSVGSMPKQSRISAKIVSK